MIHTIVQYSNDEDSRNIFLEENTVATAHRHAEPRPEVAAFTAQPGAGNKLFHQSGKGRHVVRGALGAPFAAGVSPYGLQVCLCDLRELEAPHNAAIKASIWSSFSSTMVRPAATSS